MSRHDVQAKNLVTTACLLLFVIGLVGGTLLDRGLTLPEPEIRGGFFVLHGDFHVHGFPGDGWLTPFGLLHEARRNGLHVFALTNHNQVWTARWARRIADKPGPLVMVGEEITSPDHHIIALGIETTVDWRQSARETIAEIHAQGGVAIAAHPVRRFHPGLQPVAAQLDGTERMHPLVYDKVDQAIAVQEFYERSGDGTDRLAAIGSSDYHAFNQLGLARTLVFARTRDRQGVLEALRARRTMVYDRNGKPHGDSDMIALLADQPLENGAPMNRNYGFRSSGSMDRFTRTCGWLGLLGLVLFGSRGSGGRGRMES